MRRSSFDSPQSPPNEAGGVDWLTTPEVAALLRVHPKHVYRLLNKGMPARRVGGQWRFSRDAIQVWASRSAPTGDPVVQPIPAFAPSTTSLVALAPGDVSDVVASFLGSAVVAQLAVVHTDARQAVGLLANGQVVAAVVRQAVATALPCATIRVSLGTRQIGVLAKSGSAGGPESLGSIAVPLVVNSEGNPVGSWILHARQAGVRLVDVDSEQEACFAMIRGEVDGSVCSRPWASQLGAVFSPLGEEDWELVVRVDAIAIPEVTQLCMAAQGDSLRNRLQTVLGFCDGIGRMRVEPASAVGESETAQGLGALAETAEHAKPVQRGCCVRWAMVTRERSEQVFALARELALRGLRVGGFVQVPSGPASSKPLGYDLYRLGRSERVPLAERVQEQAADAVDRFCELTFHPDSLARAWEWLREDEPSSDVLLMDGIGRLEELGLGLFPALAWARTLRRPKLVLLSVRSDRVPKVTDRLDLPGQPIPRFPLCVHRAKNTVVIDRIVEFHGNTKQRPGGKTAGVRA